MGACRNFSIGAKTIDVKNINLQIKNIKNMFLYLHKNIFKTCIKNIKLQYAFK